MTSSAEPAQHAPLVRHPQSLPALERSLLDALDAALERLDATVRPLRAVDTDAVSQVAGADARRPAVRAALHQDLVTLLALKPASAGELRVIAALLHIVPCIERIVAQCAVMADLMPELGGGTAAAAGLRAEVARLEQLTRAQVADARQALAARDVAVAEQLPGRAVLVSSMISAIAWSPAIAGRDPEARRLAAVAVVVTNALEQISEDAVEIAEQVVTMTCGLFQELAGGA